MHLFGPAETKLPTQKLFRLVCLPAPCRRIHVRHSAGVRLSVLSLLWLAFLVAPARVSPAPVEEGIRFDLPLNGRLHVENKFGDIDIRVGKEREVLVAAKIGGLDNQRRVSLDHSPIVVETKRDLLSISVVRLATDPPARINLTLVIPENTRAEIITTEGTISSHGLPASMLLSSLGGHIRAELESPIDADILAQSTGAVRSQLGSSANDDPHEYRARFGPGQRVLRARSQRGEIILSTASSARLRGQTDPRAPELQPAANNSPGAGTPAKQSPTEEVDEGDVIRVDAQLVTLNLSVVDRGTNRGLVGLTQADFKLFENGVQQQVLRFESSSAPFDLVLVIDLSGSTREVVKLIRAAARRFVDAARPADRIAIITFAGSPTVVSQLTLDRELLRQRVNAIDTLPGDTKLYDASAFAMAEILKETKNSRRTAIVLMSDGLDGSIPGVQGDGSVLSYAELLDGLREFDGVLYALWLNTYYEAMNDKDTQPEAFDTGHDRMKEMADTGGGVFNEVERLEDLAGAYERVVADLGTVYGLAYRPLNKSRDGKWRAIHVEVERHNAVARGKHGYYAN
jgi:VWFA-related protein